MARRRTTDSLGEYMIRDIAKRAEEESRSLLNFISPIYRVGDRNVPEQFGTGTLLRIGSRHFIVTAAHVLDDNASSTLYVPGNNSGVLETKNCLQFGAVMICASPMSGPIMRTEPLCFDFRRKV
jgi:hypothetical protein